MYFETKFMFGYILYEVLFQMTITTCEIMMLLVLEIDIKKIFNQFL